MRRLAVLLAATGLLITMASPGAAAASKRPIEYLALGDSLAFGYSPLLVGHPAADFVGYPDVVGRKLGDRLANASCPGETSSHFISLLGADHGCGDWRTVYGLPLHQDYTTSQLEFMDHFLQTHPKVRLVTIDIGANDVGALRDRCMRDNSDFSQQLACLQAGMPEMLATLAANLDTIYGHLRNVDGYTHKLVALTVYSPNYADPVTTGAIAAVNQVVAERTLAWNGIMADGFGAFAAATAAYGGDSCAAGLLIRTSASSCDDHASSDGHDLLARAVVRAVRAD